MEDIFLLPVTYKGETREMEARLLPYGYTYRFEVLVNDIPVQFEPDEERNYRALIAPEQVESKGSQLSTELLEVIAEALKALHA